MFDNVSFVLIARNESFGIQKALSVLRNSCFREAEIILVDSGSVDDTSKYMEEFESKFSTCKHVKLTGALNASIARNEGLRYATRKFCFFVDGDTEISIEFVQEALEFFNTNVDRIVTGKQIGRAHV